jgi:anti-sigma factor RsiW
MTPCPDHEPLLQALLDGELDAANALSVEAHLRTCPGCAAHYRMMQAVRTRLAEADLSAPASPVLRRRIDAMIAAEDRRMSRTAPRRWWEQPAAGWSAAGAIAAVAASLFLVQAAPMQTASLQDELVSNHVRSLLASHLIDIPTSDRHVVKPWFNGKIDFAPPVVDLADQGFPLVGGRLDYAGNREVAALVYKRRAHVINLFILPVQVGGFSWPAHAQPTSYSIVHWRHGDLDFWAVSDVEAGQLEAFHQAFASRAAG